METKPLKEILDKIREFEFREGFDMVVAIGRGGIIPAAIINQKLKADFEVLWLKFRDDDNEEEFDGPTLVREIDFSVESNHVLIVDDVANTGKTLEYAKQLLDEATLVKTFAVNGPADYSLYKEKCFKFPWNL